MCLCCFTSTSFFASFRRFGHRTSSESTSWPFQADHKQGEIGYVNDKGLVECLYTHALPWLRFTAVVPTRTSDPRFRAAHITMRGPEWSSHSGRRFCLCSQDYVKAVCLSFSLDGIALVLDSQILTTGGTVVDNGPVSATKVWKEMRVNSPRLLDDQAAGTHAHGSAFETAWGG